MRVRARLFLTVAVFSMAIVGGSAGWAQEPSTVEEAEQQLAALEKARPDAVPPGALVSIRHYLEVADRYWSKGGETENARRYFRDAKRLLARAKAGQDPFAEERGLTVRAYESDISQKIQPYSIYVPESYDPSKATPLIVILHGGSSNHSLFIGVFFNNNVPWAEYSANLRTLYVPRWDTDWLVVAPNGFGQVLWRWMGEQDVLDVIADVQQHYNVDENQIVLNGVSNGGMGTYSIGARHAWRFAAVIPMAGSPSWRQYLHGAGSPLDDRLISAFGAWDSVDNLRNTGLFRYFHGNADTGPMRPHFVTNFRDYIESKGVPSTYTEFAMGHDIMYRVHQRGKLIKSLSAVRRNPRPEKVWVVAWDYRARRQHWLRTEHFINFYDPVRMMGEVSEGGDRLSLQTKNTDEVTIFLRDCPIAEGDVELVVDGQPVKTLGAERPEELVISRQGFRWVDGPLPPPEEGLRKRPGLSGPLTDVIQTCQVHAYGTQVEGDLATLRKTARRAATGLWAPWAWEYQQEVVADSAVTDEMLERCSLVLYGDVESNSLIAKVAPQLPIKLERGAITLGERRFEGKRVGTRFVVPNPLAEDQYLVVQSGNSAGAVADGNNLPDFLPDYVIYDETVTGRRPRGVFLRGKRPLAAGFFDDRWRLPER